MAVRIDQDDAYAVLEEAIAVAQSDARVPARWLEMAKEVAAGPSRTFTAALGTALLAKATEPSIDPLSLKVTGNRRSYSARTLCHGVLVPASREYGFDLGATGREPLNNQPFFRYVRIDQMPRVHPKAREAHRELVRALRQVDRLGKVRAEKALAAYLRTRLEAARRRQQFDLRGAALGIGDLADAVQSFISEDPEVGRRGQAFVAAAFDLVFDEVLLGRIHDPSRRMPGDVQVMSGAAAVMAAEVRQKPVSLSLIHI